jgi:excisionase family DNA binding protein
MKNLTGEPPAASREVMTLREAAAYLNCHHATLYRLVRRGEFPFFKVGSDLRFKRSAIDEWIARQISGEKPIGRGRKGKMPR